MEPPGLVSPRDDLVEALAAAFIDLTPDEQQLVVAIYTTLLRGRPATVDALATSTGWAADELNERLHRWPGVYLGADGGVVGFWGAATQAMIHRVDVDGSISWAWCALDPLFILPMIGATGRVASRCATTGQEVSLTVSPDAVTDVSPASAAVSFLFPDRPFDADVQATFCHFVLFFASHEAGELWTADHPDTFLLTVEEAAAVGRQTAAAVFDDTTRGT